MGGQSISIGHTIDGHPESRGARSGLLAIFESWIFTVDHKKLGIFYILYGVVFLVVAGIQALLMRIQLFYPYNTFVSPYTFNRLFTMHGTAMVFFVGMPLIFGFANYLVPLMIGARDMAFPRLNAFSFWISAFAGPLLYSSYFAGTGPDAIGSAPDVGWFAYAPLTEHAFSPGHAMDYWTISLLLSGIGSIGAAINILATVFCMRCKGMTLLKIPLLPWVYASSAFIVLVAVSPLTACQAMLMIDRYLGGHFFDTAAGGSAILWAHFFWIFGHPEVYVLILPIFGFASEIIPVFSRKAIFGYPAMVAASVCIAFIGLGVWAHHMFTMGMTSYSNAYFTLATMLVGVPTGIKVFNWLATMWGGKIRFELPMMFSIAFLFQFVVAGLTGIMLSVSAWDWQLHNSYFVVAHFHYVLVGAFVFMTFAALYYWYPKITGRMLNNRIGLWHFWLLLIGFHLTFDTMHIPGLLGMPRNIFTYEADRGWTLMNQIMTVGGFIQAIAVLLFAVNMVYSYFYGKEAGPDPWDAWTLEWSTSSPPPSYNFAVDPEVFSRRPLWDLKHPEDSDSAFE